MRIKLWKNRNLHWQA